MMRSILSLAFVAFLASAAVADEPTINVTSAWARATPSGAMTGAAYVTIVNKGAEADRLISAATPVAGETQLHTTINDNGVMKMRPVQSIELKSGASLTLKPGGYHLMLMQLKQPLKEGDIFPLELTFAKAGKVEANVMVRKVGAMSDMGDMNDMPGMNMK